MTIEAETAREVSYQFEAKKDSLKQVQSGDIKVTFTIHPDDMPAQLYLDPMGQRFVIVAVPLNDDETPRMPEKKKGNPVKAWLSHTDNSMAVNQLLHGSELSMAHFSSVEDMKRSAEAAIESQCMVKSCSEISEGTPAWNKFKEIQHRVMDYQRHGV